MYNQAKVWKCGIVIGDIRRRSMSNHPWIWIRVLVLSDKLVSLLLCLGPDQNWPPLRPSSWAQRIWWRIPHGTRAKGGTRLWMQVSFPGLFDTYCTTVVFCVFSENQLYSPRDDVSDFGGSSWILDLDCNNCYQQGIMPSQSRQRSDTRLLSNRTIKQTNYRIRKWAQK